MTPGRPLHSFRRGETPTTRRLNSLQVRINPITQISTGGQARMLQTTVGTSIDVGHRQIVAPPGAGFFPAVITGHTTLIVGATTYTNARWKYAWAEASFDSTGTVLNEIVTGRKGTTSDDFALNLDEMAHIAEPSNASQPWYLAGVDAHGSDYPTNFACRPIGGGGTASTHRVRATVQMSTITNQDGGVQHVFTATNSHDGTC